MERWPIWVVSYLFFNLIGCEEKKHDPSITTWKNEILETEKEFAEMASEKGMASAFLNFAADEAVLMRNDQLIIGKTAIKERFGRMNGDAGRLSWSPDFVDVSSSGDLGYTYGKYVFTSTDSVGNEIRTEGVFHTVWKRQPDGAWKFVWD